uniref:Uncharacterized protein n=1 Tax=Oryza brachyantha TaxID=4533 RepID=J3MA98_ORYBR
MAVGLYSDHVMVARLSSLVAFCARHLSRATRRLLRDRRCYGGRPGAGDGEAIWRRTILMGERCQPLDFDGAIHYDSFGRRLAAPRSASSLSCSCRSDDSLAATSDIFTTTTPQLSSPPSTSPASTPS